MGCGGGCGWRRRRERGKIRKGKGEGVGQGQERRRRGKGDRERVGGKKRRDAGRRSQERGPIMGFARHPLRCCGPQLFVHDRRLILVLVRQGSQGLHPGEFQGFLAEFRELTGDIPVSCSGVLEVCCRGGFLISRAEKGNNISHMPVGLVADHVPDNPASENLAGHVDSGAGLAPLYHHHACLVPANVRPWVVHRFP